MSGQTNKVIQSRHLPKTTNVTWIDTSGELPVSKYFINGMWRPTGGSSGGSGDYSGGSSWPVVPLVKRTPTLEDFAKFAEIYEEVNTAIDLNKKGELPNPLIIDVGNSKYQVFTLCSVYNGDSYESGYANYMYKAGEDHFVDVRFFVDPEATVMLARMTD